MTAKASANALSSAGSSISDKASSSKGADVLNASVVTIEVGKVSKKTSGAKAADVASVPKQAVASSKRTGLARQLNALPRRS